MSTIFNVGNIAAGTGWLALLVALFIARLRWTLFLYSGLILPALFALSYVGLLVAASVGPNAAPDFTSLAGVKALFSHDATMTVGWYHYLAFDLVVGTWITRDGLARGASPLLMLPILLLTMFVGPAGLLAYLILWLAALRGKAAGLPMPQASGLKDS